MAALRKDLLVDPYFRGVPSMQIEVGKTARHFHAKDDTPEVRREVFKLLCTLGVKVQVVIRHKERLVQHAKLLHERGSRLRPEDVYDDLVKRLFRNLLHKADTNRIVFAKFGKRDRKIAMASAIRKAQRNFERKWHAPSRKATEISALYPWEVPGLQVVDYYMWALQRLYERREDRYFEMLKPGYRLIMDLDDTRRKPYGEWYSDTNPLSLERIQKAFW